MKISSNDLLKQLKENKYGFATILGIEYINKSTRIVCQCECSNILQ